MKKILIIDDHAFVRDGIKFYLKDNTEFQVTDEASNGLEALNLLKKNSYDIVLTDVRMPDMDGIELLKIIKSNYKDQIVIMLSMHNEASYIKKTIELGADGYILKRSSREDTIKAFEKVLEGNNHFSEEVYQTLITTLTKRKSRQRLTFETDLTKREMQVLSLILEEYSNREIAEKLSVSVKTVETHKRNLMIRTGCKNVAGLVIYAMEKGLI